MTTTVNVAELCRLCVNQSYYHANVFQKRSLDGNRVFETLNAIFQLNIAEGDELPKYICMQCNSKVSEIEIFKQKSHKGRRILLTLKKKTPLSEEDSELKEWNTTDWGGTTRCSGGEEIEIEEHPAVLKIEQVEEPNEVAFSEECGMEEDSFKAEIESPKKAFTRECDSAVMGGVSSYSDRERIGLEEHHAVVKMERVEEPNEGEILEKYGDEEVSSVPDCLTVFDKRIMNSEAEWHYQEPRIVDVQTVKGSLEMCNLERCEMPMVQKASNDKANKESAVIANGCYDNNEENREEWINKEMNMYKGRLRKKIRNINEKLADQYMPNGIDCRRISTNNGCQKIPLGTKNHGDSIACSVSQEATKKKSVVKKTIGTPEIISKGSNSLRNKSKSEIHHFLCDTCKKGFRFKSDLGRHVRIHNGVRPYQCSRCSKSFSRKGSLLLHNSVHTVFRKPHVCTECGKSFMYKCSLREHNKLHRDHYPFPCVTCGKLFKSLITFHEHLKIHGNVKPFSCKICNKSFGSKVNLVQHQKMHEINRNKPFSCDTCKKSFSRKQLLQYHMYTHSNFKSHKCSICAKRFSLKEVLKRHMLIHSTEKLYKCPSCSKCYKRLDTLRRHMRFNCKKQCGN